MHGIDHLKILVALLAAEATNAYLTARFPNRTEEQIELDSFKRYCILTVRTIIIFFSVSNKWPLPLCVFISVIITILAIVVRTSIADEIDDKENSN